VPLLCAQEIPVPGSLERCIRVLVHCYAPVERVVRHVYLREARRLRLDLIEEPHDDGA
jgi:chorismate mutase